jgi:lysozyme family protein
MSDPSLAILQKLLVVLSGLALGLAFIKYYMYRKSGKLTRSLRIRLILAICGGLLVPGLVAIATRSGPLGYVLAVLAAVGVLTLASTSGSFRDAIS